MSSRACASGGRLRAPWASCARVRTAKTKRRTSAQTTESACSFSLAGRCRLWARVGSTMAATASMRSVAIIRGRAALEAQHLVPPAAGHEGEAEDEERVDEDRADQRGLHQGDEPGPEREDADEELGQVADRRLDDAGRRRAEVVAEVVGRLADQVGDPAERQRRRREGEERRGGGEVQRASQRHQGRDGRHHRQLAALHGASPCSLPRPCGQGAAIATRRPRARSGRS